MTTAAENERLGVLEIEVAHIKKDVSEIKSDVKSIVASQQQVAISLAASQAADAAVAASRSATGTWVRFFAERTISIIALVVAALSVFVTLTR
jgi:hypothetical protein